MNIVAIGVYPTKGRLTVEVSRTQTGSSPDKVESDEIIALL
jgi:hypothetical protein